MGLVITTIKLKSLKKDSSEKAAWLMDLHRNKLDSFSLRVRKIYSKSRRPYFSKKGLVRSGWYCIHCHVVFFLQPRRKFKVLLQYQLKCPVCKSIHVLHSLHEIIMKDSTIYKLNQDSTYEEAVLDVVYFANGKNYSITVAGISYKKEIVINML